MYSCSTGSQEALYGYTLSLELEKIGFDQIPKGTILSFVTLILEKRADYRSKSTLLLMDLGSEIYYSLTEQGQIEKETCL